MVSSKYFYTLVNIFRYTHKKIIPIYLKINSLRQEEPGVNCMDISTGHMVLSYMEDHLTNKQRLEQEWVGLCAYEAEPNSTSTAFKVRVLCTQVTQVGTFSNFCGLCLG